MFSKLKTFDVEYGKYSLGSGIPQFGSLLLTSGHYFSTGGYFSVRVLSTFAADSTQLIGNLYLKVYIIDAKVFSNTFDSLQHVVRRVLRHGESSTVTDSETDNDFWTLSVHERIEVTNYQTDHQLVRPNRCKIKPVPDANIYTKHRP